MPNSTSTSGQLGEASAVNVPLHPNVGPQGWKMSCDTEKRAVTLLEANPHFRGRGRWVKCHCWNRQLFLDGKLPSFYLKQLAQETLRDLDGIDKIENRIVVANPRGVVGRRR